MFGIERKVAHTAKRAGLITAGLILAVIGVAFLTAGAWFALVPSLGPSVTAFCIAVAYLLAGLICISLAQGGSEPASRSQPTPDPAPTPADSPPIVQAFMYGLQAGAKAKQPSHPK